MSEARRKADGPIIAGVILALVAVALGVYVWGYLALGAFEYIPDWDAKTNSTNAQAHAIRLFSRDWEIWVFYPAALVESAVRGKRVSAIRYPYTYPDL